MGPALVVYTWNCVEVNLATSLTLIEDDRPLIEQEMLEEILAETLDTGSAHI